MEEKNIKITINVECSEKSSVKKEQIAGYLLRAIAGVTANNKCLITNYICEINEKNDDKLQEKYITGKPKLTKDEKSFLDGLDPSWSYMLRNGKGQLYLARKVESMYGSNFKYLYLEGIGVTNSTLYSSMLSVPTLRIGWIELSRITFHFLPCES